MRVLGRLLERAIPRAERDEILGDLLEERSRTGGGGTLWLLGQLLVLGASFRLVRPLLAAGRRLLPSAPGGLERFLHDLAMGLRTLVRRPGHGLQIVAILALGIAVTTTLFTLVNAVLLRPLPFAEPDRLMRLGERMAESSRETAWSISPANLLDLRAGTRAFEGIAAFHYAGFNLSGEGLPVRLNGMRVTHDFFSLLGIRPLLGRVSAPAEGEPGAEPVAILGQRAWRGRFGGNPDVLGRTIQLDGVPHRVIGVVDDALPFWGERPVWVPFAWSDEERAQRRGRSLEAIGRLADGVTPAVGLDELERLYAGLAEAYPETNAERSVGGRPLRDWILGTTIQRRLPLFALASVLVLLMACINVASLQLARLESRGRELALRSALGAGRGRLARMLLAENLVLASLATAVGLAAAGAAVGPLVARFGSWIPRAHEVAIDGSVLAFAAALALAVAVVVALVPAARLRSRSLGASFRGGAGGGFGGRSRAHRALVVAEIALALVLTFGAGLLLRSAWRLDAVDLGMTTDGVFTFTLSAPRSGYPTPEAFLAFYDRVLEALLATPGTLSAAAQNRALLSSGGNGGIELLDPALDPYEGNVETREIVGDFFATVGMPIRSGRTLEEADRRGPPVAVVNEAFVRELLDGGPALGTEFRMSSSDRTFRIVGVVADMLEAGPEAPPRPTTYMPYGNGPWGTWPYLAFVVRSVDPRQAVPAIRSRLAEIDPTVPLADLATVEEVLVANYGRVRRMATALFAGFAAIAVLLGSFGVYAVMAYAVSSRTHEVGVRLACGASAGQVRGKVLGDGMRTGLLGILIGAPAALLLSRTLESLLYGVGPADPSALLGASILLLGICASASLVPAARAAALDPVRALRRE